MDSYYDVLGVAPEASSKEIKSAFRRQAKRLHPDLQGEKAESPGASRAADAAIRLLLEAYRVLLDPERRRAHDRSLRRRAAEEGGFDYRRFLKERPGDPESQAKLVVFDLLHSFEEEALETYERAKSFEDFRLERYLERGEAMDAEFCLAEEYEKRGRWIKAYSICKRLVLMEAEKPCFRYFFDVVALHFRNLILLKLSKVLEDEDYLDVLDEAASLPLPCRDAAQLWRKKAEIQMRLGRAASALDSLEQAARAEPRLAGLAALMRRAGSAAFRSPLA